MNEDQAKQLLSEMLTSFTLGSILHLLADLHASNAIVQNTLIVIGVGIDSVHRRIVTFPHSQLWTRW